MSQSYGDYAKAWTEPDIDSIKTEDDARQVAIDWQYFQATEAMDWSEVAYWLGYFELLANKFNLVEEFKENGIL